jgi:competence protein ComEA
MFKKFVFALMALFAAAAFAAVDVNKATQADLETVKGIGPAIAGKILDERKKGAFKDWADLVDRVKGVGDGNAGKFSEAGLTVGGASFKGAAAAPAAKKEEPKKAAAAPAAPAADDKAAKAAAKKASAAEKKAKAEDAKAAKVAKAADAAASKPAAKK